MNYVIQPCSLVFGNWWGLARVMMGITGIVVCVVGIWHISVMDNVHASQLSFVSNLVLCREF